MEHCPAASSLVITFPTFWSLPAVSLCAPAGEMSLHSKRRLLSPSQHISHWFMIHNDCEIGGLCHSFVQVIRFNVEYSKVVFQPLKKGLNLNFGTGRYWISLENTNISAQCPIAGPLWFKRWCFMKRSVVRFVWTWKAIWLRIKLGFAQHN